MFAKQARHELKPGTAKKWAHETKDMKHLPERKKKRKSKHRSSGRK